MTNSVSMPSGCQNQLSVL